MTSPGTMDVFSLRDFVVEEYERFATSFTTIHAADLREKVEAIYDQNRYWPEPLIQVNPNYKRTKTVAALEADGSLAPGCADIFPLQLFEHQREAIALANQGKSYVVTTGTGSGKSLCFFIPIVSAILAEKAKAPDGKKRTRAIVIYPMNALANSQREELEKYLGKPETAAVTFERYTGQESRADRERVRDNPPDILLTNFMMLELLMTRQDEIDQKVIGNCEGLRFLVLDELHTYRGRQGADVALLVRRIRERLSNRLQCVGTSATMKSEGSAGERNKVVAEVASRLFAADIKVDHVVGETLERLTTRELNRESIRPMLGAAIDAGVASDLSDAALAGHPLAIWVETVLGMNSTELNRAWHRAPPLTVTEAGALLAEDADRPADQCERVLRAFLLVAGSPERDRVPGSTSDRPFFPFKLHQFISGAGHAFATLEAPGTRSVTVEGQQFLPSAATEKRLYATHFCRHCGQEYHPVRIVTEGDTVVWARDIDDALPPLRAGILGSKAKDELAAESLEAARDRQRATLAIIETWFNQVINQLVGGESEGTLRLDGHGLHANVLADGDRSTVAINALKVAAFDIAVMAASVGGRGSLPGFLMHDSPREADLSVDIYERLFLLVRSLEGEVAGSAPFQYIITTTTPPPKRLQQEPWLVAELSGLDPENRLLRRSL